MVGGLSSWESVRRGSISGVDFDALDTDDLRPMRPPLIVTAVALNRARHIVMVVPLATGPQPRPPIVIDTPSAGQGRVAGCDQACAVDKGRLTRTAGRLSATDLKAAVDDGLRRSPARRARSLGKPELVKPELVKAEYVSRLGEGRTGGRTA